jgi:hypothetical protein
MMAPEQNPRNSAIYEAVKVGGLGAWGESPGNWGLPFWTGILAFFGTQQFINYFFGYIPFGGIAALITGIPLAALIGKYAFIKLSGGQFPTLLQGALLIALGSIWHVFGLSVNLAFMVDDGATSLMTIVIGTPILMFYMGWGITTMEFWKRKAL